MRRRTFLSGVGVVGMGGLAGCSAPTGGGEGQPTGGDETMAAGVTTEGETTTADETTAQGGGTETVEMVTEGSEYYFDPIGLFVEPGDTVEWVIESGAHSSTAYAESIGSAEVTRIPEAAEPWNSGTIAGQGSSFSYTFEETGTYDYFCIPHKTLGMIARIVCGEPGDVDGDPPDGDVPAEQAIVEQGAVSYDEFTTE